MPPSTSKAKQSRRDFLRQSAQGAAVAATGGIIWMQLLPHSAQASPSAIRPPGALPEADFSAQCIKCGQCVRDCPYDTLKLATLGDDAAGIGTPYFTAREVPCYMCDDIPCAAACPTGALDAELDDIKDARMGLAVIDIENCLSWQGLRCEICHRECPVQNEAITIEHHPRKLSKHAMFVPLVHSAACTGCGVCEKACPTELAAIRVLPPGLVQGKIGAHYRLGWKQASGITQDFDAPARQRDAATPATGLDYLNDASSDGTSEAR